MNRRRVTILVLGIVLLAMIVALLWPSKEVGPLVGGVPLSKWLRSVRSLGIGAVAEVGTNAIPFLARAVQKHDLIPYQLSARAWRVLPISLRSKVPPPVPASQIRMNALLALRGFGPEAEPALAVVIEAATKDADPLNRSLARQAAVTINADDPRVLALLERDLRSSDPMVRGSALVALYTAGICPRPLTNFITLKARDTNQFFFTELLALGASGPEVTSFVPRILPFLSNDSTRGNALAALQRVGPGGAAAVPGLIECLRAPKAELRSRAAEVLMRIGVPAKEAAPALEEAMRDDKLVTRVLAAAARWRITDEPTPSLAVILAALQTKDDGSIWSLGQRNFGLENYGFNSRMTALWFAGEIGSSARECLPILVKLMQTGPDWQRVVAARSVWKVEGSPERSLLVLKACLASKDESSRILACYIAGEIGSRAATLLPDLEKATRTTLATRRAALDAIKTIRQNSNVKSSSE